ncbi:hypothetical protein ABW21_db0202669 [Orbilia brochopaga]|nr:hypothetical protein ABW21_db0202669 [Drechslerella brochopaga]
MAVIANIIAYVKPLQWLRAFARNVGAIWGQASPHVRLVVAEMQPQFIEGAGIIADHVAKWLAPYIVVNLEAIFGREGTRIILGLLGRFGRTVLQEAHRHVHED